MSAYKSDFLNVLASRGFIHQVSEPEALDALARQSTIAAYIGFDCTAPSLHVGSLLPIMMLHWLQQTGHRPIPLMGGGPTPVGDPSGKDESRRLPTPPGRRSVWQGRNPPAAPRPGDRREPAQHPRNLRALLALRRRQDRCGDGQ